MSSEYCDLGLAALGSVHVGAVRGDLEVTTVLDRADRPEGAPLRPHRVGPRRHQPLDHLRPGARGDVDVAALEVEVEEGVAHGAADEVGLVALGREELAELADRRPGLVVRLEPLRDVHPAIVAAGPVGAG